MTLCLGKCCTNTLWCPTGVLLKSPSTVLTICDSLWIVGQQLGKMDSRMQWLCVSYRGDGKGRKWERNRAPQILWAIWMNAGLLVSSADRAVKQLELVWVGRNGVFHFSCQGITVLFCLQNSKVKCSIDKEYGLDRLKNSKRPEVSLHARKCNYKIRVMGMGLIFSRNYYSGSKASYHI